MITLLWKDALRIVDEIYEDEVAQIRGGEERKKKGRGRGWGEV